MSETFLILERIQRGIIINAQKFSCKGLIFPIRFQGNLNFLDRFSKNTQISDFMTVRQVEADLFHADRQTDRHDEANRRFSQFCRTSLKAVSDAQPNSVIEVVFRFRLIVGFEPLLSMHLSLKTGPFCPII